MFRAVGSHHRPGMKADMKAKPILLGVLISFGIVGIVAGAMYFSGGANASKGDAACGYSDCDWTGRFSLKPGDAYPLECAKCGRASVLVTSTCKKCGNQQVLNELLRQLPGREDLPRRTECEQCGGPIVHGD